MHAAGQERSATGMWMLSAFAVALVIAGMSLALRGPGEEGTVLALKLTARWSYLWFWVAYTVGAWATLLGPRLPVAAARARDFGLAFAAAHLVHVGLVAWLYRIALHPPGAHTLRFFGVAVFFTYLLALLSFRRPAAWLTPRAGSVIRTIGVEYIALGLSRRLRKKSVRTHVPACAELRPVPGARLSRLRLAARCPGAPPRADRAGIGTRGWRGSDLKPHLDGPRFWARTSACFRPVCTGRPPESLETTHLGMGEKRAQL